MSFLNRSISRRLIFLVTLTIAITVIAFGSSSILRETTAYKKFQFNQLSDQSKILATVMAADVANKNKSNTYRTLSVMGELASIDFIDVKSISGRSIASLGNRTIVTTKNINLNQRHGLLSLLRANTVSMKTPIIHGGIKIGELHVFRSTDDLKPQIMLVFYTTLLVAVAVMFIGLFAAWYIQQSVTRPINALTNAMEDIEKTGNYDTELDYWSVDEFNGLINSFNRMAKRIRERDVKLDKHRKSLESTIHLRTEQYKEARDEAESANAAKSDFLAMISHEIRTPLNGMLVMAELLTKAKLPSAQDRHANVIYNSGTTLLSIINDILDLSKIESGKMDLESIPFSPKESIENVINLYTEKAKETELNFKIDIDPSIPENIIGDPVRISQILSNLVNNALKFTKEGYIEITCKIINEAGLSPIVYFSVEDSGIGIPKGKQQTIFEAFSQADQSTTRLYGGTGLGLSICRRLVNAMRGKIGLSSEEGKGSKFWFAFPTEVTACAPTHSNRTTLTNDQLTHQVSMRENLKILVVDDNPINIEVMREALQQLGLNADTVTNGEEAVIAAQSGQYNFVFMDGSMPVLDGFAATRKIRTWEQQQNRFPMTIVALSAHVAGTQSSTYSEAGMDDYISKPFTLDSLIRSLEKFSDNRKPRQALIA